jgi:hypothetical protein
MLRLPTIVTEIDPKSSTNPQSEHKYLMAIVVSHRLSFLPKQLLHPE